MKKLVGLVITLGLFIGGCSVMDNASVPREEENRVIAFFRENYKLRDNSEIEKIEIIEFKKNQSTQTWVVTLQINDKFLISFKENNLGEELRSSNYSDEEFIFLGNQE